MAGSRPAMTAWGLLLALNHQIKINIAAGGVAVGADLIMGFLHQGCRLSLCQVGHLHMHFHGNAEAAALARANRGRAGGDGARHIRLMLAGDKFQRAAKAGSITGGKQMFRRGGVGQARATHFLAHRKVDADRMIGGFRMAIAPAGGYGNSGDKRLDGVCRHGFLPEVQDIHYLGHIRPVARVALDLDTVEDYQPVMTYSPRLLSGLHALSHHYDVVLSDIWGVVHNGLAAYEEACAALMAFRQQGGTVVLITNAPRPCGPVSRQLAHLQVPSAAYDAIVTSGDVALSLMAARGIQPLFHIGPERDLALLEELSRRVPVMPERVGLDKAEYVLCTGLTHDDKAPADFATSLLPAPIEAMLAAMKLRNLPMICANPDIIVHVGDELYYCAGALGERYKALGGQTTYSGKPYAPIYHEALRLAAQKRGQDTDLARVLAIGDAMHTDVAGAGLQGIDVLMVTGGIHREAMHAPAGGLDVALAEAFLQRETHQPTFIIDALR